MAYVNEDRSLEGTM